MRGVHLGRTPANPCRKALLNGPNPSDGRKGTAAWQDSWVKSHRKWHFRAPKAPERRAPNREKLRISASFPRARTHANVKNISAPSFADVHIPHHATDALNFALFLRGHRRCK
jgi:hypothetical protein